MLRVVAKHVVLPDLDEAERVAQWLCEVARSEGVEGWVAPREGGLEAWFEGSCSVVDSIVAWCQAQLGASDVPMEVTPQRPCLRGGFEVLKHAPA